MISSLRILALSALILTILATTSVARAETAASPDPAASAGDAATDIPIGETPFSNLARGHFIADGTFHFSKSTVFLPDRGDEPVSLAQLAAGTTIAYFVSDGLALGLSTLYSVSRYGSTNFYSMSSGPGGFWFFHEEGRIALRLGAGFYWDTAINPTGSWLSGFRLNTNLGMQYFFLPSIAVGPALNVDFVSGQRFSGSPELSFGGGSTIYL